MNQGPLLRGEMLPPASRRGSDRPQGRSPCPGRPRRPAVYTRRQEKPTTHLVFLKRFGKTGSLGPSGSTEESWEDAEARSLGSSFFWRLRGRTVCLQVPQLSGDPPSQSASYPERQSPVVVTFPRSLTTIQLDVFSLVVKRIQGFSVLSVSQNFSQVHTADA